MSGLSREKHHKLIHHKINVFIQKGEFSAGLNVLNDLLGDALTLAPSDTVSSELVVLMKKISEISPNDITLENETEVPFYANLLSQAWALAFLTARTDLVLQYTYSMAKTVEEGFSVFSAPALSTLCGVAANHFGDLEMTTRLRVMKEKCDLLFPHPVFSQISRTMEVTYAYYYYPYVKSITHFQETLVNATRLGVFNWASYAAVNTIWYLWVGSFHLDSIYQENLKFLQAITKKVDRRFYRLISLYKHMAALLKEEDMDMRPKDLLNTYVTFRQPSIISELKIAKKIGDGCSWYCALWARLVVGIIFINRPHGVAFCQKIVRKMRNVHISPGLILTSHQPLLEAFVHLKTLQEALATKTLTAHLKSSILQQLEESAKYFKKLTEANPFEWRHKVFILEAILCECQYLVRPDQSMRDVIVLYKKAIEVASQRERPPFLDIGLTSELLNDFVTKNYSENPLFDVSTHYYAPEEAYYLWGSKLKVKSLKRGNVSLRPTNLDVLGTQEVLYSLTALTRDCSKEELLGEMLKILLKYSGAQKGTFLIGDCVDLSENLNSSAEVSVDFLEKKKFNVFVGAINNNTWNRVPKCLVKHVRVDKEPVLIDNANSKKDLEVKFLRDPYFQENNPMSVLCMPLNKNTSDILYLENYLASHLFSVEMVDFLKVISQQVVLILEAWNAYHDLRLQVMETQKANKFKQQQATFIDSLCHEMRNPLNGLFGSLDVLEISYQDLKHREQYQHVEPFGVFVISVVMIVAAFLPFEVLVAIILGLFTVSWAWKKRESKKQSWKFEQLLREIKECLNHQKAILDDTLQVHKLDSPNFQLEIEPASPSKLIASVLSMFVTMIDNKGLQLIKVHKGDKDIQVMIDVLKLKQVLINIISNAVKFTDSGKIEITTTIEKENEETANINFTISDTGSGFSDSEKKLFNYFEQLGKSVHRNYGGSGLGLAISKKLIELMGGTITASSEVGKGSTFMVILRVPIFGASSSAVSQCATPVATRYSPETLKSMAADLGNILVVDDNMLNRKTLIIFLARQNLKCLEAENGIQAINLYKKFKIDYIVMDIKMPIMDGIAATKVIRKIEEERGGKDHVVIIGLSGNHSCEEDARDANMDEFMIKPTPPHALLQKLVEIHSKLRVA
eukprot:TRINITY_DN5612_c0_g1_i1.p1 TRINITY_DN5612_c0_g1~~TRINITY_DN5612_c0_g1_i1.p1  ORF type:complete len:1136 (+),score=252.91 TRINITY_DN5612_c0_g1_i1:2469-5876(+)